MPDTTATNGDAPTDVVKAAPTTEVGASGLTQFGGRISEEHIPKLRGDKRVTELQRMGDDDPVVGGLLLAIEMICRKVEWFDEAPDDDDWTGNDDDINFATQIRNDMSKSWEDTISQIVRPMVTHGWQFSEIVYKQRNGWAEGGESSQYADGRWSWRKLAPRPADTLDGWKFDDAGGVAGMKQRLDDGSDPFIPIDKALLFRTTSEKDSPEGRSLIRNAWPDYYYKLRIRRFEAIGIERELAGLPVVWVPPEYLADDAPASKKAALEQFKRIATDLRRDEEGGVAFPLAFDENGNRRYDLTLLSTGGRRQIDTDPVIRRYDQRIAMSALADFLLLGHEGVGSLALGTSKVDLFTAALTALVDGIAAVITRHGYPRIWRLNGLDPRRAPRLTHSPLEQIDIGQISEFIKNVAGSGAPVWPNDELMNHLYGLAGFPPVPEELQVEDRRDEGAAAALETDAMEEESDGLPDGEPADV